jgi:hypothetical protein
MCLAEGTSVEPGFVGFCGLAARSGPDRVGLLYRVWFKGSAAEGLTRLTKPVGKSGGCAWVEGGPAHGNAGPSPPPERRALTGSGERRANTNAAPDAPSQT